MRATELARQFDRSLQTIRNWIVKFDRHLKISSAKESIDQQDFIVLATIHQLSLERKTYDEIHTALDNGELIEDTSAYVTPLEMIPLQTAIDGGKLVTELEIIKAERDALAEQLQDATNRAARYEQERDASKAEMQDLLREIAELKERLGRAEMEAEMLRKQRRRWF